MKAPQYTTREVVTLLFQAGEGIDKLLKNKGRLKDVQLGLILALAVECLGDGNHGTTCTESGSENPQDIEPLRKEQP